MENIQNIRVGSTLNQAANWPNSAWSVTGNYTPHPFPFPFGPNI